MNKEKAGQIVTLCLLCSITLTGLTGFIAAELDLHRFVPHKYLAFTTLFLACLHVYFNSPKLRRYFTRR